MTKTWQGRFRAPADPLFERFTSSTLQDRRLAQYDVRASQAHARALARAGVISAQEAEDLVHALSEIAHEVASDDFVWRDDLEDVHTHVEARLREKVGEPADALHAGRSRNDQIATDLRLFVKDRTCEALYSLLRAQQSLLTLAERYRTSNMPGYTHLQQAQPVLIAQPLLAYVAMLGRDWERFRDGLARTDRSPLGSGALAGSTFALDRDALATWCGFGSIALNSLDAVSDRDFLVEFVFSAALCMTHLSRLAEDLILWSSTEFGFVRLPEAFSSGSSMMPQKKNPDVAELVRGKSALVIGDVAGALALVKGLPLGYNRDLQDDKTPLYHAADTLLASLQILAAMLEQLEFNTERTEGAVSSFALATDLADALVQAGTPFREAHSRVGRMVSSCLERGIELTSLSPDEIAAALPELDRLPQLTAAASVSRKKTQGSTAPAEVERQMVLEHEEINRRYAWLESVA
ncbi:MAG TPA: argininosuccinate lyase [Chloroflexota bacterium]